VILLAKLPGNKGRCELEKELRAHLARIIHIFEDNKSLLCYKHVV
jgi:hypothetical protein